MNYQRLHDSIISAAQARGKPSAYSERHHILPKSMGGTDCAANLVWLTAREHYLVHWLLFKIYRNRQMAFAWYRMTHARRAVSRYSSHSFAYAKKARAAAMSELFRGGKATPQTKANQSAAKKGRTYSDMGRDASPLKGRPLTDAHKRAVFASSVGRKFTDAARSNIRAAKIGEKNPQFGKTISESAKKKIAAAISACSHLRPSAQLLSVDGETKTAAEWSRHPLCCVTVAAIYARIRKGWSHDDAIFAPKLPTKKATSDRLRAIKAEYRAKLKELEKATA